MKVSIPILAVSFIMGAASVTHAETVPPLTTFYLQLDRAINTTRPAKVYDIDMADNSASLIAQLKSAGHTVMCYFSGGTTESYRDDVGGLPASVIGKTVGGWPDEHWLDIRAQPVKDLMIRRLDASKAKGCSGVDPDEVAGYQEATGFPLTKQDSILYNSWLADEAHARGMMIALKYSPGLVKDLVGKFDFSITEQCFQYKECATYSPFVAAGKAVMAIEYSTFSQSKCDQAKRLGFTLAFYGLALNGNKYRPCP